MSSGGVNVSTGRLHHNPSRVDKLLVDVQKEHAKVTLFYNVYEMYISICSVVLFYKFIVL